MLIPIRSSQRSEDVTLQAVTAAVSPKGIEAVVAQALDYFMQQSLEAPDESIGKQNAIPVVGSCTLSIESLELSKGSVSKIKTTLKSLTQKSGGVFDIDFTLSCHVSYASWHEKGHTTCSSATGFPMTSDFDQTLSDFYFGIDSVTLQIPITLAAKNGLWVASVANAKQSDLKVSDVHIPSKSELNDPSLYPPVNDGIKNGLKDAIESTDFAKAMEKALNKELASIPVSGHLTSSIVYEFAPTYMTFPNNAGIMAGITGGVLFEETPYPAPAVVIAEAPVDPAVELSFYVGNYELDALLWAFYEQGSLSFTITPQMVANPMSLNTTTYQEVLPQLYNFAPGAYMELRVQATAAPTADNGPVWWLSPAVMTQLQSELPSGVYDSLAASYMVNVLYASLDDFNTSLSSILGPADFDQYSATIDAAAQTLGLFVTSSYLISVYCYQGNQTEFAFSFAVTKDDVLTNLAVGVSGTAQVLHFRFNEYQSSVQVVDSAIGRIANVQINTLWSNTNYEVDQNLQQVGQAGVALPSVSGFLFANTEIALVADFIAVATDVAFTTVSNLAAAQNQSGVTAFMTPTMVRPAPVRAAQHRRAPPQPSA